eukprot:1926090-Amphidinium_carterae.1
MVSSSSQQAPVPGKGFPKRRSCGIMQLQQCTSLPEDWLSKTAPSCALQQLRERGACSSACPG